MSKTVSFNLSENLIRVLAFVFSVSLSFGALGAHAFTAPLFTPNIVDQTNSLTEEQKHELNLKIEELQQHGIKAAVYLLPTSDESIETTAEKTFRAWKLGDQGVDNGVLLIFALNDRSSRIEVGYGLEGDIPDIVALHILDNAIHPHFRNGEFAKGIGDGLEALRSVKLKDGKYEVSHSSSDMANFDAVRGLRYWLVWMAFLANFPIRRMIRGKRAFEDGMPWFIYLFLAINPGLFIYLSPLFVDDLTAGLSSAWADWLRTGEAQKALIRYGAWLAFVFFFPVLIKAIGFVIGRIGSASKHPVYKMSLLQKAKFFSPLSGWPIKTFFAFMPGIFFLVGGFIDEISSDTTVLIFIVPPFLIFFFQQWRMSFSPLLSDKRYKRFAARERLNRIRMRTFGTREIFGKSYTYNPSTSSSSSTGSSSRSSYSSSSGGGRSGGGGASSRW